MSEIIRLHENCLMCGKEITHVNIAPTCTTGGCRGKWYRQKAFIEKIDFLIKENKIEEIEATIKQLKIMGYTVKIERMKSSDD